MIDITWMWKTRISKCRWITIQMIDTNVFNICDANIIWHSAVLAGVRVASPALHYDLISMFFFCFVFYSSSLFSTLTIDRQRKRRETTNRTKHIAENCIKSASDWINIDWLPIDQWTNQFGHQPTFSIPSNGIHDIKNFVGSNCYTTTLALLLLSLSLYLSCQCENLSVFTLIPIAFDINATSRHPFWLSIRPFGILNWSAISA